MTNIKSECLSEYNAVVDSINEWNDIYYKMANDMENLIDKYYDFGSLELLYPVCGLLNAIKERNLQQTNVIELISNRLKDRTQELL